MFLIAEIHLPDIRLQSNGDPPRPGGEDQAGAGGGGRGDQRGGGPASLPPVFPPLRSVCDLGRYLEGSDALLNNSI